MMLLEFKIEGQLLKRIDNNIPVANSKGYLQAHVDLPEEYKGTITLNVKRQVDGIWTNTAYTIDRQTGLTNYLDDVLADTAGKNFNLYFWLSSYDTDIYIPTNEERVRILASGDTREMIPQIDKSTNQYEETVLMYSEIRERSETTAINAENARVSELNAKESEENAEEHKNIAVNSANTATEQAKIAVDAADIATQSADICTEKANIATTKANEALQSANIASTKASEALQSANVAKENADKIDLNDKITGTNYKIGIENGEIYLEVV